jgi:hypothetical protein
MALEARMPKEMKEPVEVLATANFYYNGKVIKKGETVSMPKYQAIEAAQINKVDLDKKGKKPEKPKVEK